jgi:hypothetical protein
VTPEDLDPPPHLEDRIVERLRAHGLLRTGRPWSGSALAAAATLVFGFTLGAWWPAPRTEVARGPRFLLLLYPGREAQVVDRDASARAHAAWVAALRERGREIRGERLAPDAGLTIGSGGAAVSEALQGFFVVGAPSLPDAVEIARGSPHVREGGRVVVRAIDTPSR